MGILLESHKICYRSVVLFSTCTPLFKKFKTIDWEESYGHFTKMPIFLTSDDFYCIECTVK